MRFNLLKNVLFVSVFGLLIVLLGTNTLIFAQAGKKEQAEQKQLEKKERKVWEKQVKAEDSWIKNDQKKEQVRIKNIRTTKTSSNKNRYRLERDGTYYETNYQGAELLKQSVNAGYQEGYRAGRNDRNIFRSKNYNNSQTYRNGNYGYQSYVSSGQYKYYFQQGFQRGYDDGFINRYDNGTNTNGSIKILNTILDNILSFEPF